MKSLCIDVRLWACSGIGSYLQHLVPLLLPSFYVTLLAYEKDCNSLNKALSKVPCIPLKSPLFSPLASLELAHKIPSCDLFWSPHYNIPLLPLKARKRVVTIHDLCPLALPNCFPRHKRMLAKPLLSLALKHSDLVMVPSQFSCQEVLRCFPGQRGKIHVVPCGAPLLTEEEPQQGDFPPFLLYVGNIKAHKNIERLIQAFQRLTQREEYKSLQLILAGTVFDPPPSLKGKKENITVKEGLSRQEIFSLYRKARCLVHPSLYEGFGMTPLEAMSCRCLVLSSPCASLPEVCGEAALFIQDPFDVGSIEEGMRDALSLSKQEQEAFLQKGLQQISSFSWKRSAEKTKELFFLLCLREERS